jgi:hypothetical protein
MHGKHLGGYYLVTIMMDQDGALQEHGKHQAGYHMAVSLKILSTRLESS